MRNFSFLVGGVIPVEFPTGDPLTGVFLTGSGTTDALNNFATGTLTGTSVGGTLGGLLGLVVIDLPTGNMTVTVGGGSVFVASVEGGFEVVPEPATATLVALGTLALGLRRRRAAVR